MQPLTHRRLAASASGRGDIPAWDARAIEIVGRVAGMDLNFGVGLALFDLDPKAPNYQIRMRAQRFSADMFYVNELADRLRTQDPETFEKLFR